MKRKLLSKAVAASNLDPDLVPKASLIELFDDQRVLIENHISVLAYSSDSICVKMQYGHVCVWGQDLLINKMCKDQLVIMGEITAIQLNKGGV